MIEPITDAVFAALSSLVGVTDSCLLKHRPSEHREGIMPELSQLTKERWQVGTSPA